MGTAVALQTARVGVLCGGHGVFSTRSGTTREKLSSGAGFLHTSSTGTRATARALQLLFNSSAFLNKRCS